MRCLSRSFTLLLSLLPLMTPAAGPQWSVEKPPGVFSEVAISVTEGSWMSLDVSPDGKQLAFELLGDLYLLPIKGGIAEQLTRGLAWDMQPRFAPDGRSLVFTSDRGGSDNLWQLELKSGVIKPLSSEQQLANSPAWSPDGLAIAAHTPHNGGEIWLYHRDGGLGTALLAPRPGGRNYGEPAFSGDGRYLYYSLDISPYSLDGDGRDPNRAGGLYAIERLDRASGEQEQVVRRSGGAVRPTPSPDGRYLAFVGRDGSRSALYLLDLVNGRQQLLDGELDQDLQQADASHGLYPQLAWSPSGDSLFYWAGGRLNSINLDNRKKLEIPFQVDDSRTLTTSLRFRQQLAPAQFEAKAIRFARISPAGDALVFEALGHLWLKDLPHGKARRLSENNERFELYPAWSRDGRKLLFTTWSDREQGSIRLLDLASRKEQLISSEPGKYVEPEFSPDGKSVLYRKLASSDLLAPEWSQWPGIYLTELEGGTPRRISQQGVAAHFANDNNRIFFTAEEQGQQALISINRDGQGRSVQVLAGQASELRIAPNGQQLAYVNDGIVYTSPLLPSRQPLQLSGDNSPLPQRQRSLHSGGNLSWSKDSSNLYWTLGPDLYSQPISAASGAEPSSSYIGLLQESSKPQGKVALIGGRILTMVDDQVIEDGAVIIDGDRITAVGPRRDLPIPEGAVIFDIKGATLMPGLIDARAQSIQSAEGLIPQQNWRNLAQLAFGVTSIVDHSPDGSSLFAAGELQKSGAITAPRLFASGDTLSGNNAPIVTINSLADAERQVQRQKKQGAFSIASAQLPRRDQRQQLIAAARLHNMMATAAGGGLLQHSLSLIVDGYTSLEQALPQQQLYADVQQLMAGSTSAYTPLLNSAAGGFSGASYWYRQSDLASHPRLGTLLPPEALRFFTQRTVNTAAGEPHHLKLAATTKALNDWGVVINSGSQGQSEGLACHWEMWNLVEAGMAPIDALASASRNPAISLGLDEHLGSVEPGKLADLIVVSGNPLTDIRSSEKVRYTVLGGVVYDAASMNPLTPQSGKRPRLYFEAEESKGKAK